MMRTHSLVSFALACCLAACSSPSTGGDAGPGTDSGTPDSGVDAGPVDAGFDAGPVDSGFDAGPEDSGFDAGPVDSGFDAGPVDSGFDAGPVDSGFDAGPDAGIDAGVDAGVDAGPTCQGFLGCDTNATCSIETGAPGCTCNPGYEGDGVACISRCDDGNNNCDGNATCSIDSSGVVCTCNTGYTGSGTSCASACTVNNGGCSTNANCSNDNATGAIVCNCKAGFTGNGYTCASSSGMVAMQSMIMSTVVVPAFTKFNQDTGGWPWANTEWDVGTDPNVGDCSELMAGPYSSSDTAIFGPFVTRDPNACNNPGTDASKWMGPYLPAGDGPSLSSMGSLDVWGNPLHFTYIPPPFTAGGGDVSVPNGAVVIWSTGPDGIDETGCSDGKDGNCSFSYPNIVCGQTSDCMGVTDDLVTVLWAPGVTCPAPAVTCF